MDVRNSLDGLSSLLGINQPAPSTPQGKSSATVQTSSALDGDSATLSSAANEISQSASSEGVRADKVAAVQAALAAGTYSVPASAVASKVIDSMLGGAQ